jgi:tripartite-type tricarboxylate transporter receptor subunit TctC
MVPRRLVLSALGGWAGAALAAGACREAAAPAGACPTLAGRRLRWIVPNAAGGGYDTESRLLQPLLERRLGATILVDNRAGAGGLVGARAIASAPPDGRTLGIVGVPGLLVASLTGAAAPNPATAFTVLGRIGRSGHVWAAGARSGIASIDDLPAAGARRPLVCGINEVGSASFVAVAVTADLLGVAIEFVSGFDGARSACLAAMRGDVDLVCYNFETIRGLVAARDLRPLLQLGAAPIATGPLLDGVPLLGGEDGVAARRARASGRGVEGARRTADALADVMGGGRLIVAPAGLPGPVGACLTAAVGEVLTGGALRASTRRALDPAPAAAARADVERAVALAPHLLPAVDAALQQARRRR